MESVCGNHSPVNLHRRWKKCNTPVSSDYAISTRSVVMADLKPMNHPEKCASMKNLHILRQLLKELNLYQKDTSLNQLKTFKEIAVLRSGVRPLRMHSGYLRGEGQCRDSATTANPTTNFRVHSALIRVQTPNEKQRFDIRPVTSHGNEETIVKNEKKEVFKPTKYSATNSVNAHGSHAKALKSGNREANISFEEIKPLKSSDNTEANPIPSVTINDESTANEFPDRPAPIRRRTTVLSNFGRPNKRPASSAEAKTNRLVEINLSQTDLTNDEHFTGTKSVPRRRFTTGLEHRGPKTHLRWKSLGKTLRVSWKDNDSVSSTTSCCKSGELP